MGLSASQLGDNGTAERELKQVASSHNDDLAALAKMALATVYRNTNRTKDAIDLYNSLIAKPARTVSKATAQMELAETYSRLSSRRKLNAFMNKCKRKIRPRK